MRGVLEALREQEELFQRIRDLSHRIQHGDTAPAMTARDYLAAILDGSPGFLADFPLPILNASPALHSRRDEEVLAYLRQS